MSEISSPPTPPKPRRRWLQLSLRTLMVLMLVFGAGFGWLAHEVQQARAERKAMAAIAKLGGRVEWSRTYDGMAQTAVFWVGKLSGEYLHVGADTVKFSGTQVTDAGLVHLRGLTQLQTVLLDTTQVTDTGLEHLQGLTQLGSLELGDTQVTDAGLMPLKGLTRLQTLDLWGTRVSDAGLKHLKRLTQLQRLGLAGTQVTDAGLVYVRGLTQLRELSLDNTQVSDAGVNELEKALPNVTI